MQKEVCPLCRRSITHLLQHLVVYHRIKSPEDFHSLVQSLEKDDRKALRFRNFVSELRLRRERNEITAEEYRTLIMNWSDGEE
jgi:hypothetical protein